MMGAIFGQFNASCFCRHTNVHKNNRTLYPSKKQIILESGERSDIRNHGGGLTLKPTLPVGG